MASYSKTAIFNVTLAALAGAAAGFATFAMPADLLEGLVAATGLPSLLTAASPPLGATARLCIVGMSALSLFVLVWLVLRAFDPPSPRKASARSEQMFEEDGDDWLSQLLPECQPQPTAPVRGPLRAIELDEVYSGTRPIEPPIASHVYDMLELEIEQIAGEDAEVPAWDKPAPVDWNPVPLHLQANDADEEMTTAELLARLPLPEQESASVASLVQRLNAGLASSEWPLPEGDEAPAEMDDRLRGVLHDLQKMAGGNA